MCRDFVAFGSLPATPLHDGFSVAWVRTGCGPEALSEAVSGAVR